MTLGTAQIYNDTWRALLPAPYIVDESIRFPFIFKREIPPLSSYECEVVDELHQRIMSGERAIDTKFIYSTGNTLIGTSLPCDFEQAKELIETYENPLLCFACHSDIADYNGSEVFNYLIERGVVFYRS